MMFLFIHSASFIFMLEDQYRYASCHKIECNFAYAIIYPLSFGISNINKFNISHLLFHFLFFIVRFRILFVVEQLYLCYHCFPFFEGLMVHWLLIMLFYYLMKIANRRTFG